MAAACCAGGGSGVGHFVCGVGLSLSFGVGSDGGWWWLTCRNVSELNLDW